MFLFILRTTADYYSTPYSNTSLSHAAQITKPNCPSKCSNVTAPYPFSIGVNATCSIDPLFDINCSDSFNPPEAFILNKTLEVFAILDTKICIRNQLAWSCFNEQENWTENHDFSMDLSQTLFSFLNENKLTVMRRDDLASRREGDTSLIGLSNGSCSGIGCCHASIPKGLQFISAALATMNHHVEVHDFNPCGYLFLAEKNGYSFNNCRNCSAFDWAIGNGTCDEIRSSSEIMCQGQSASVDSERTLGGYRCNSSQGYRGNPYLRPGCQVHAIRRVARCNNLRDSFNCSCPPNYFGDGTKNGTGCIFLPHSEKKEKKCHLSR
ncbi:hypothetical protein CDL12_01013 [Handroanthus impetiginosus]|uniref:Wall-associated receptor kinase galacturonan-binding domain-containing protein n=1 Tax=Handroanthus impetiginosus TaxID=429701 RepID=A0A2G9I902_9LAMI|nr:hypothetical protein CDL12_01013 [Handroanthus impetiginosus]